MNKQHWTQIEAARMLANPYYTGILVHSSFIHSNPPSKTFAQSWIKAAKETIHASSPTKFLHALLESLKRPRLYGSLFLSLPVHEAYTLEREPLIPENMFIECGCLQIATGANKYLQHLLENLECPGHAMSLLCK